MILNCIVIACFIIMVILLGFYLVNKNKKVLFYFIFMILMFLGYTKMAFKENVNTNINDNSLTFICSYYIM